MNLRFIRHIQEHQEMIVRILEGIFPHYQMDKYCEYLRFRKISILCLWDLVDVMELCGKAIVLGCLVLILSGISEGKFRGFWCIYSTSFRSPQNSNVDHPPNMYYFVKITCRCLQFNEMNYLFCFSASALEIKSHDIKHQTTLSNYYTGVLERMLQTDIRNQFYQAVLVSRVFNHLSAFVWDIQGWFSSYEWISYDFIF